MTEITSDWKRILVTVFILVLVSSFSSGQPLSEPGALTTVMIDPGHGGSDPGAVAAGIREKDIVLDVSLRLGKMIQEAYPEVKVLYTRSKDVFIPLHARASAALKNKADLFISVHANWVAQTHVRGTETFTLGLHRSQENLNVAKKENSVILLEEDYTTNYEGFNPNETESYIMFENMQSEYQSQSISFAAHIQNEFTRNLKLTDRGVKQAGFLVLREVSMPGVLVEIGFISNPVERKFLVSEEGKAKVAQSIFKAFKTYKTDIDSRSRFVTVADATTSGNNPGVPAATAKSTEPPPSQPVKPEPAVQKKEAVPAKQESSTEKVAPPAAKQETASTGKVAPPAAKQETASTGKEATATKPVSSSNKWYAVQIGAVAKDVPPTPENFKGEKNLYKIRVAPYFKYFSGKFSTIKEAVTARERLSAKFPKAFVVVVENGVPRQLSKNELP